MRCAQCAAENPVNTLFCVNCGAQMSLSQEEVHAAVYDEIRFERGKNMESVCRSLLGFAIVLIIGLSIANDIFEQVPDPDLVPHLALPPVVIGDPPFIQFGEAAMEVPDLSIGDYLPPATRTIKKAENELRKKVLSTDNVILIRKAPLGPIRCRLLRADKEYYYIIIPATLGRTKVHKKEVIEIKKAEEKGADK